MSDRGLGMQPVEMENVDAFRFKFGERIVKVGTEQTRKRFVVCAIMFGDLGKRGFVVTASVLIAAPGIDAETARAGLVLHGGLAEREITFPAIDAEFDEQRRSQHRHEVIGKMEMARPRSHSVDARFEVARGQIRRFRFHAGRQVTKIARW